MAFFGSTFGEDDREEWEKLRDEANHLCDEARRLHLATHKMLGRVELANVAHCERELDESGTTPAGKTPAQEEIETDNEARARAIADENAINAARFILDYTDKVIKRGYP